MTAQTIINKAFDDLGIYQVNESIKSADAQGALSRLNALVQTLKAMPLTVLSVERWVFNLVANQQTYFIGPQAQLNVPTRPTTVNGAGLLLNGLTSEQTVVSITRASALSFAATATVTSHGYAVGQEVIIAGAEQDDYNGAQTVTSVPTSDTFVFQVANWPTTPATGTITVQAYEGTPVEIPRAMLSDDAYQSIQLKTLTNTQFTNVYYNPTQPFGTIWLWPIPTTASNQLVLYLQTQFDGFADLTTDYTYPTMPAYGEMLEYELAKRLIGPYGVTDQVVIGNVMQLAAQTLSLVKRQNYRITDLPTDPALVWNVRGGYNLNTGNM